MESMESKPRPTLLDIVLVGVAIIASTPIICLAARPDLFMQVASNPVLNELTKYLIVVFAR